MDNLSKEKKHFTMYEISKSTVNGEKGGLFNRESKRSIHKINCEESDETIHEKYYENNQITLVIWYGKGLLRRENDQPAW